MLSRRWLYVLALGGCLALWAAVTYPVVAQGNASSQVGAGQQPEDQSGGDVDVAKAAFDAAFWGRHNGHPANYQRICAHPRDREYADLCQQWRAANAANRAANWSIVQAVVGFFGILGLLITIHLTSIATGAANRAVRIANRTLKHAEIATKQQLRAYLLPDKFAFIPDVNGRLGVEVTFKNTGQTPARKVSHVVRSGIGPLPKAPSYPIVGEPRNASDVGPGQVIRGGFKQRNGNDFLASKDLIAAGTHTLYVYGWVTYFDVFDAKQTSNFRYMFSVDANEFVACDDGNQTT